MVYDPERFYGISRVHTIDDPGWRSRDGRYYTDSNGLLALLELSTDIHFDEHVQPVCLASNDNLLLQLESLSRDAWVVGWGTNWRQSSVEANMIQMHLRFARPFYGDVPFSYFLLTPTPAQDDKERVSACTAF